MPVSLSPLLRLYMYNVSSDKFSVAFLSSYEANAFANVVSDVTISDLRFLAV